MTARRIKVVFPHNFVRRLFRKQNCSCPFILFVVDCEIGEEQTNLDATYFRQEPDNCMRIFRDYRVCSDRELTPCENRAVHYTTITRFIQ